jgi:hypothetical protein
MKKIFAASAVALVLSLTGCYVPPDDEPTYSEPQPFELIEKTVYLSDGRTVLCLVDRDRWPDVLSCDWENAE